MAGFMKSGVSALLASLVFTGCGVKESPSQYRDLNEDQTDLSDGPTNNDGTPSGDLNNDDLSRDSKEKTTISSNSNNTIPSPSPSTSPSTDANTSTSTTAETPKETPNDPGQTTAEKPSKNPESSDSTTVSKEGLANQRLFAFYTKKPNYDKVFKEVLSFYPAGRSNGCVAFLSSALRQTQTFVPKDKIMSGYNVSLVTIALSDYLTKTLKWKVIRNVNLLQPGDVVMTLPPAEYPGIPAHTYMFQAWKDRKNGIGIVIDNQDFSHERNIFGSGTYNFTPFWYALRSPAETPKKLASSK